MVELYSEENLAHEVSNPSIIIIQEALKELYKVAFRKGCIPDKVLGPEWKDIGFQGQNPRTDFRGGGILGLHCLRYFLLKYPEEFLKMQSDDTFFFAITSINLTHMLMIYFYMNKYEVQIESKRLRAGRKQFKRFARLNSESKSSFFEL